MEERFDRLDRSRDPRDRRFDQLLETGRQLVDGVSGRRPGQRRGGLDLDSVGRWVGDKVEWLLEEDDAWREPWQESEPASRSGKRPLEAISRRGRQVAQPAPAVTPPEPGSVDDWPEDDSFRVGRWQRPRGMATPAVNYEVNSEPPSPRRSLPRSSRRRD